MLNKPKFNIFKNSSYAIEGLIEIFRNETSFKIEIILFIPLQLFIFCLPIAFSYKAILSVSIFIPILAEIINSAIERVVDLVTKDYHHLAKSAKDAGSALVFVSIVMTIIIWISTIYLAVINYQ
jgi:diacylglycerol kinase (ATP)